jgi:adenylate cyclase
MSESHSRRLAAILAADIAGYSALMGADEARTVRDLKGHQAVVLPMVGEFGGRIIDTAGDGILAEFPSVVNAVKCAVAIQSKMAERNTGIEPERRMQFRVGINVGDVVFDEARIYGEGINVAARLEVIAEPGGICISSKVYEEISGRIDLTYEDIGQQQLKNIARPIRAYRVRLDLTAPPAAPALPLPGKPSIAVLPFQNMSGDPEQDYFADGMVEEIITALSRFRQLFVIARNSTFTYKGQAADVKQVSRELGVRYVLEGSVRKGGNRVRVTAQLIDATSSAHVWAERYDRDVSDVFAVQDEITASVAGVIEPTLADVEQQRVLRKPPERLDAWEATNEDFGTSTNSDLRKTRQHRPFFAGASSSIRILPLATMDWPSPFSGASGTIQRVLSRKFKEPLSQKRALPFRLTTRTRWRTRY